jgi:hypothetical protein
VKAHPESWKRVPFTSGVPVPFSSSFTLEEFDRIAAGLVPQQMEDKWFIYYEPPYLIFHRSWTGQPVYRLMFATRGDRAVVEEALISRDVADVRIESAEYHGLLVDFLISNLLLGKGKPFPVPEHLLFASPVYQHHVCGTANEEYVVAAKKPWWRLWWARLRP